MKVNLNRKQQMEQRKKRGLVTISIIGYTNAGKTALFNLLTNKNKLVENTPFATLDSSVGSLYLTQGKQEVLVTDTIGFIQNLPTELIDSFQSTLMETTRAELLLMVVDMADAEMAEKIETVKRVLADLSLENKKLILVFNKIDLVKPDLRKNLKSKYAENKPQLVNATTGEGKEKLIESIMNELKG
jgi:GTP-binding protein HflX